MQRISSFHTQGGKKKEKKIGELRKCGECWTFSKRFNKKESFTRKGMGDATTTQKENRGEERWEK